MTDAIADALQRLTELVRQKRAEIPEVPGYVIKEKVVVEGYTVRVQFRYERITDAPDLLP